MAETYQILLIEKDKQVADDVRRFLRASAGGAGFSVECQEDLIHGQSMLTASRPDAVIIDAAFIDKSGAFNDVKRIIAERHIPVLVLSATNGQDLRNKAATAGAVDYLLKNKLNYFYLPRVILSAIRTNKAENGNNVSTPAHAQLLDRANEAVIVADTNGDVLYSNKAGSQMLGDSEALSVLRRFLNFKHDRTEFKATIRLQAASYELNLSPQEWSGHACMSIHIHRAALQAEISLDAKVALLDEFIRACSIPFVMIVNGLVHDANDAFLAILSTDRSDISGKRLTDFISISGDAHVNLLKTPEPEMVQSIMGANVSIPMQLLRKTVTFGGQEITICSIIQPGHNDAHPLSAHRLMEIASHDLREPMRTSANYLHLLTEALKKEGSNKKLLGYAETITAEVGRADRMLADMKTLMNLQDKAMKPEKLNMLNLIQDTMKQLKPEIDLADAMVNVSEMPQVKADPDDIRRLLYHLIDNALKFRKSDKRPYIEILSARAGHDWQFCIKDNGIGIAGKYHTVIFEPFRKLNRVDEYPGAGNGLCICRHIVEMHKGRIWVESHEGFGSSFFFTLPAA